MKPLKRFFILGLIILVLNIIWEFSHYSLYVDLSGIPKYPHLIIASFTDLLLLIGIFGIVSFKNKNFEWIKSPKKLDYLLVALLGFFIAILIDLINLGLGRWQYTDAMPTIFGIGVSPLVQLAITGVISLAIISHLKK